MEWILYYSYQRFQKNYLGSIPGRLLRFPVPAVILLCLLCVNTIAIFIFALIPAIKIFTWISVGIELICCVVLYLYTESYQVKASDENLEDYRTYCNDIYKWLQSCSFSTREEIQEIRTRLLTHIEKAETDRKYKKESMDKWLQVLVIPVILAILSAFMNQQTDFVQVMNYASASILIFLVVYGEIWGVRRVRYFFSQYKLQQVQWFADDLQGVLDTQFKAGEDDLTA